MKPIVLFTTPVLLHPPIGGPYLRIENSIKALSEISDLYIYSRVNEDSIGGKAASAFYRQYCKKIYFDPLDDLSEKANQFLSNIFPLLTNKSFKDKLSIYKLNRSIRFLLNIAKQLEPDIIWLGYGNISYPLLKGLKKCSNYTVVTDTDSVWSRFILRRLSFVNDPIEKQIIKKEGRNKAEEESWGTPLADVTTAVSNVDAEYYRTLCKHPDQVKIFSNVIDLNNYKLSPRPPKVFNKPCLYLAGTFFPGSPMEDAVRWLFNRILPTVWEKKPDVHLYIIGNNSDKFLPDVKDSRIIITGYLHSVLPYLCNADIALVPLRFESGTRFKILEAGACNIPVISTSLGAEGLSVTHEKDILLADDPSQFSTEILRLLDDRNLAFELAHNLRNLIKDKYSIPSLIKEGNLIIEYLQQTEGSKRL